MTTMPICLACGERHARYGVTLPPALLGELGAAVLRHGGDPLQPLPAPAPLRPEPFHRLGPTCQRGHPWSPATTGYDAKRGKRHCKVCRRERRARREARA